VLGGIFGRKAGRAMKRLKIAVLFGGCSPEYSVSLQSAATVLQNMDSSKYWGQTLHTIPLYPPKHRLRIF